MEARWYRAWEERNLFHADETSTAPPYCIVIPPPNVTGSLHMGHALNNTLQDILIRWHRMCGDNTLWMPGTDHAGIATQNVVERQLRQEGLSRDQLGREAFVERVWKWKRESGGTIIRQLRTLGASCDWARERFTLDPGLSEAVKEVFCQLYEAGLIYRGNYIINWCPRCQTALSDLEVEYQERDGKLWHLRYPLADGTGEVVVATTRPETMLGDTAVAVHPEDERLAGLQGRRVLLPVMGREIPIIADTYVDREFGTGFVKVTPAHDPKDFECGLRHDLPQIKVIADDGRMNENAGPYAGQDRFACRKGLVQQLEREGFLVKVEDHRHAVGHCYRCQTVVEPSLSRQWFVKMAPLAEPAIRAVETGKIRIIPSQWEKTYFEWMRNIRDWCISRQIWWGHRIPAWYCDPCGETVVSRTTPTGCPRCGGALRQETDVLDTWFSSGLWPFSTLGWPEKTKALGVVLSDGVPGHRVRYPVLLGGPDDHAGAPLHGRRALPGRGDPRPDPGRAGREDVQDPGERHRSPARDQRGDAGGSPGRRQGGRGAARGPGEHHAAVPGRLSPVRRRRAALHAGRAGGAGERRQALGQAHRGLPPLLQQDLERLPLRGAASDRRGAGGAARRPSAHGGRSSGS